MGNHPPVDLAPLLIDVSPVSGQMPAEQGNTLYAGLAQHNLRFIRVTDRSGSK
jgi:hypothetical protein